MTTAERDLLLGMAEAIYLLLHHDEAIRLSHNWKGEVHPSDRLARLIATVQDDATREGRKFESITHAT